MQHLTDLEGIRVPRVLGGGVADPGVEYTLMTRMPGAPMRAARLDGDLRRRALVDLGRMLRRIHGVPQQPLFEARLIPGDHVAADVRTRFGNLFDDAVAAVARAAQPWPFALEPLQLARLAMRALPDADAWVASHSNPGPEHVFVDPQTGQLTGIIDFGDAYFSHPALDLRRWPLPTDRAAVHAGYCGEAEMSESFSQTWRVACVLADMLAIAQQPECRAAGLVELEDLVEQLR